MDSNLSLPEEIGNRILDLGGGTVRRVPILLTSSSKVALLGESRYFQWTENDDIKLFQDAVDHNEGVFGLGFIHERGIHEDGEEGELVCLDKIALMQIEDFNTMGQELGIFCKAKVVGRASMLYSEPCTNLDDDPKYALCSEFFDRRETLSLQETNQLARKVLNLVEETSNALIHECRMPEAFNDDDDDEEETEPSGQSGTRLDRFKRAYKAALLADTQGYYHNAASSDISRDTSACDNRLLSWKQINAVSWAAYAMNKCLEVDQTYRVQAMDFELVSNRLQFAVFWLSDILIQETRRD